MLTWFSRFIGMLLCTATAMVGYTIHHSIFWAIVDFLFWPVVVIKWLICHDINISIIKQTFGFLLS
jgi:hypothetical protein